MTQNPPKAHSSLTRRVGNILVKLHILPKDERPPLIGYFLRQMPFTLLILVLTGVMEYFGWFRGFETYALDAFLNLENPTSSVNIVLVVVDDHDYEQFFHGTSPLDPKVLNAALQDIHRSHPAVVVVDVDTSKDQFGNEEWPECVWFRGAQPVHHEGTNRLEHLFSAEAIERVEKLPFLGGKGKDHPTANEQGIIETTPRSGTSLLLADADGVIRRFRNLFKLESNEKSSGDGEHIESLSWAVCRAYAEFLKSNGQEHSKIYHHIHEEERLSAKLRDEEIILRYGGHRDRFKRMSLSALNEAAHQPFWESTQPLKGAIVIFGGTYSAGRDFYFTPVGPRYGIELVAHTIESNLTQTGLREYSHVRAVATDFVVGLVMLLLLWRFPGYRAFLITIVAAGLLSLLASFVAFNSMAYWFNFVPMIGGLWLHYQWERLKENQELHHELKTLRAEVARLKT